MKPIHEGSSRAAMSPRAVAAQLQEALVMAGMVSLRNDLAVEIGDWWAFNWKTNVITLPMQELLKCPREEICWIILHEAAHAALTRLHEILPPEQMQRPEVRLLLNCVEDVRIENWLVERFPGSRPWKQIALEASIVHDPKSRGAAEQENPARGFLRGLMRFGETGALPEFIGTKAREALEEVLPALEGAFACVPPSITVNASSAAALYARHPVARCYARLDMLHEPSTFEKWVRIMQASMWTHVSERVLPVFLRLVGEFGAPQPPQTRTVQVTGNGRPQGDPRSPQELQRALRAELNNGGSGRYLNTVQKYGEQVRSITELLLQLLPNQRGLRHVRRCRSGDRLDLRVAAQFEADRRLHEQLWMRRQKRTLPDPAFVLLLDRSGSMRSNSKAGAAFESAVLMREACTRAGIPFSVIIFNGHPEVIHGWDQMNDQASEAALSAVLRPDGGTCIASALTAAGEQLEDRPERDRFVFLMSDGSVVPEQHIEVRSVADSLSREEIRVVPFGIGSDGCDIACLFPDAALVPDATAFPTALAKSLVRALNAVRR